MFLNGKKFQREIRFAPLFPFYPVYRQRLWDKTQIEKRKETQTDLNKNWLTLKLMQKNNFQKQTLHLFHRRKHYLVCHKDLHRRTNIT